MGHPAGCCQELGYNEMQLMNMPVASCLNECFILVLNDVLIFVMKNDNGGCNLKKIKIKKW